MFRHIVIFQWKADSTHKQRAAAVAALNDWKTAALEFGVLSLGFDARLSDANGDVSVIVDFDCQDDYLQYARDQRHQRLIHDHIAPILAQRLAVQYEIH